jgi:hypothetical protein
MASEITQSDRDTFDDGWEVSGRRESVCDIGTEIWECPKLHEGQEINEAYNVKVSLYQTLISGFLFRF